MINGKSKKASWSKLTEVLNKLNNEDPELSLVGLGFYTSALVKNLFVKPELRNVLITDNQLTLDLTLSPTFNSDTIASVNQLGRFLEENSLGKLLESYQQPTDTSDAVLDMLVPTSSLSNIQDYAVNLSFFKEETIIEELEANIAKTKFTQYRLRTIVTVDEDDTIVDLILLVKAHEYTGETFLGYLATNTNKLGKREIKRVLEALSIAPVINTAFIGALIEVEGLYGRVIPANEDHFIIEKDDSFLIRLTNGGVYRIMKENVTGGAITDSGGGVWHISIHIGTQTTLRLDVSK